MLMNAPRIQNFMDRQQLDILVAATPENVFYSSGFWSLSQMQLGTSVFTILYRDNIRKPCLIAPLGEMDMTLDSPSMWVEDILPYSTFHMDVGEDPLTESDQTLLSLRALKDIPPTGIDALIQALKERDLDTGKIGLDDGYISPQVFHQIRTRLPNAEIVEAYELFREIRMVKTKEEIQLIKKSTKIDELAIQAALEIAQPGITEEQLAIEFNKTIIDHGALPEFAVICFGNRSAYPNALLTAKKLQPGDVIRFDVGCRYRFYNSDLARTAALGSVTDKQQRYYDAILKGEERGIEALQPGTTTKEIFHIIVDTVKSSGIPHFTRHHCGHGIGIEGYDPPLISPRDSTKLEEGMVFCIEPPYYEIGSFGLQVEDTVVITKTGVEFLSTYNRELQLL